MASKKTGVASGAGALALGMLAAGAAAGYYLYNTNPKARKAMKAWAVKAKAEMLEKLEKMQDVSEDAYNAAADAVTARYAKMKDVGADQADALNKELKRHFRSIKREITSHTKKPAKKGAQKAAKQASRKK